MNFYAIRTALNLTQAEAAREVGATEKTWYRWEHGHSKPIKVYMLALRKMEREAQVKAPKNFDSLA